MTGNPVIEITRFEFCPKLVDWGKLGVPNLAGISLIKCYSMLKNARVIAFTIFELLIENQQGVKLLAPTHTYTHPPRLGLSNLWRSLEMPLINCKVELKLKWTKYCVLSAAGTEIILNDNDTPNNVIFTIRDRTLYVSVVTLWVRENQKLSNFLPKDLKDQLIGMKIKQNVTIKTRQMNIGTFSNKILFK